MSDGSAASRRRPRLVLTQGDPAGIGPEILLTLLTLAAPQAGGTGVSPGRAWQPLLVAERARVVDLDGALLLARDRPDGLRYDGSLVYPAAPALWG